MLNYGSIIKQEDATEQYMEDEEMPSQYSYMHEATEVSTPVQVCSHRLLLSAFIILVSSATIFSMVFQLTPANKAPMTSLSAMKTNSMLSTPPDDMNYVSGDDLFVTASNEYGVFDGHNYPWMSEVEGTQLVEPYKVTYLKLSGSYTKNKDKIYVIDITGVDDKNYHYSEKTTSTQLSITLKDVGKYDAKVHVFSDDGSYEATYHTRFICKYVKREIRSLTDEDRNKVLDAMATVWQYSQEDGTKKFGSEFTSMDTYVAIHSQASNDILCDQFHEGSGFLTHHLAMGLSFEATIRSIDPSVTLPYWDFTIEGEAIMHANKKPSYFLEISDVLSDKWFGSVDSDNHIADGRWAHTLMPVAKDAETTQNSYGYIRSYWNNNPDPEISRHVFDVCGLEPTNKKIPNCASHFEILNSDKLGTMQLLAAGPGHGPMHVQFGGVYGGCTNAINEFFAKWHDVLHETFTPEYVEALGFDSETFEESIGFKSPRKTVVERFVISEYFHIYRSLWRSHMCSANNIGALLECPESCDQDTPFEQCQCSVPKLESGEITMDEIIPCIFAQAAYRYVNATMPVEMIEDLVKLVTTASVLEGEMLESASTADPLFWIIHPAIERLLAAKRLASVKKMGSSTFEPLLHLKKSDWLTYSYYNLKKNENQYHPEEYICTGHAPDDPALPGGISLAYTRAIGNIADSNHDGVITNWEFLVAIDPNNVDGNDYVFDNFDWSHCQ